ncbi:hypothetical protein SAMD00019534_074850 [Acytostelium subglobosum LB1]|uniref:hypothetical protein n=1 Tax=Acytostelium subglobosum LB1 TaxID=1410327 RepID=UPI000644C02F|nr:hypothetical protein SAMD00019534_074850 [Acytostelium subglobosum LB1]GAM24310.1 hypothetical protein SAMD00019534_074850 [Acytostelium subglobosum LB1]|eukprot:XP_012752636.1 hypothetical protein SAMD00019534_074850 [Acytostelium subglobosum LB1]
MLGMAQFNLNLYNDSEKSYQTAMTITPTSPFPLRGLMDLFQKTGDVDKLIKTMEALIPLTPDAAKSREFQFKLLDIYCNNQRLNDASKLIKQMLMLPDIDESARLKLLVKQETMQYNETATIIKDQSQAIMKQRNIPIINPAKRHVIGAASHTEQQKQEVRLIESQVQSDVYKTFNVQLYQELIAKGEKVVELVGASAMETIYTNYINILQRKSVAESVPAKRSELHNDVYNACVAMNRLLLNSYFPLETLLAMLDEQDVDRSSLLSLSQMLVMMHPTRGAGWVGLGYHMVIVLGDRSETTRKALERGLTTSPGSLLGYHALLRLLLERDGAAAHNQIRELVGKALGQVAQREVQDQLVLSQLFIDIHLVLSESCENMGDSETSVKVLEQCLKRYPENGQLLFELGRAHYRDSRFDKALTCFADIVRTQPSSSVYRARSLSYLSWIRLQDKADTTDPESIRADLTESMAIEDSYLTHYLFALLALKLNNTSEAKKCLQKSAQMNTTFAPTFAQLGLVLLADSDTDRAEKCFRKALSLDLLNGQAGPALSDVHMANKQPDQAFRLYKEITRHCTENQRHFQKNVGRCSWAFYRLALYQMDIGELDASSQSFLTAIKGAPNNAVYWRAIGECYRRQTKYIAALKALKHAETLLNESHEVVPELNYQIALLDKTLGSYEDAIDEFDLVMVTLESHVPSLKGKAECLFLRAKEFMTEGLYHRSLDYLQRAHVTIKQAIDKEQKFESLWKLLGDISTHFHLLPTTPHTLDMLSQGSDAYIKAISIAHGHGLTGLNAESSLKDLAINHYYQYIRYRALTNSDPALQEKTEALYKSSIKFATQALNMRSNDWSLWNIMGVVLMERYPKQSQHAFIKSIQLNSSQYIPFNNLAALYTQTPGNTDLANSALLLARSIDSDAPSIWSLQGLIHELDAGNIELAHADYMHISIALEERSMGDAMLGQAILAYAHDDLSNAEQILSTYTTLYDGVTPSLSQAYNYLGLIYERKAQYTLAAEHFSKSISLLANPDQSVACTNAAATLTGIGPENVEKQAAGQTSAKRLLEVNLARSQYKSGDYTGCIKTLQAYTLASPTPGNSAIWELVALSQHKLGQIDQAVKSYQSAIGSLADDGQKATRQSVLLVSLAMILYASNRLKQCEQVIEQALTIDKKCLLAHYLKATIYLQAGEFEKSTATIANLKSTIMYVPLECYMIEAAIALRQNQFECARQHLLKACHSYPQQSNTWKCLLDHLLQHQPHQSSPSTIKSLVALLNRRQQIHDNSLELSTARAHLIQTSQSALDNIKQSTQMVKRMIMQRPLDHGAWYALANLLFIHATHTNDADDLQAAMAAHDTVATFANNSDKLTQSQRTQLDLQRAEVLLLQSASKEEFVKLHATLMKQYSNDAKTLALLTRLLARQKIVEQGNDSKEAVQLYKQAITKDPHNISLYHELAQVYEELRLFDAALLCLNKSLEIANSSSSNSNVSSGNKEQQVFVTTCRIARHHLMFKRTKDASKLMDSLDSANQSKNPLVQLLRGMSGVLANADKKTQNKQATNEYDNCFAMLNEAINTYSRQPLANYYAMLAGSSGSNPLISGKREEYVSREQLSSPQLPSQTWTSSK